MHLLIAALISTPAHADAPKLADSYGLQTAPPPPADPATGATPVPPGVEERPFHNEFSFRIRGMTVPDSILDIWYFNEDDDGWALGSQPRPQAQGYSLGFEYCIKGPSANGIFYFDYADSTMKEGYWDDVEEPADHLDGSYIVPQKNFGLVIIGADFGYEVHFIRTEDTKGAFGLSLIPGAGLGVAIMTGDLDEWEPTGSDPAYVLHDQGSPKTDEVRIPGVLPMLDINLSLRFNFGDRVVMRWETGLHDIIYYGGSLGIMF
jgi:hypothetical protein